VLDHAEHRRVGANAEGECEDGGGGEARLAPKYSRGVPKVAPQVAEPRPAGLSRYHRSGRGRLPQGPHVSRQQIGFPEVCQRGHPGVCRAQALVDKLAIPFVEVERKLFDDLGLALGRQGQG